MSVDAEKNMNFLVGKGSDSCKSVGVDGWIIWKLNPDVWVVNVLRWLESAGTG